MSNNFNYDIQSKKFNDFLKLLETIYKYDISNKNKNNFYLKKLLTISVIF